MGMDFSQRKELFNRVKYDVLDDYKNDSENFERRKLSYDDLMELLFYRGFEDWKVQEDIKRILPFLDLSEVNWYGIDVSGIDFSRTNANIDPQTVKDKKLSRCIFDGMDLSDKNFNGCNISFASFIGANVNIDPKKVKGYKYAKFEEQKHKSR